MTNQIAYPFPTALDIRAAYALAKVLRHFKLPGHQSAIDSALADARDFAFRVADEMDGNCTESPCPVLLHDEPELSTAWEHGLREFEARELERQLHMAELAAHETTI